MYKNKAKNAQEAHECIRPTDMARGTRSSLRLEADQRKLYDLIWKRTIASQMEAARFERTTVDVASADGAVGLRATGQVVTFDGFLKVYMEGRDDAEFDLSDDEDGGRLPQIVSGERADKRGVTPEQHFTQPPPRYTEATLVKRMEELGIGRPSTYASIVSTIQDREYVRKDKNRLIPEDKGRLVTAFLSNYFGRYVDYDFTADLETDLDQVTTGDEDWKALLARFWARLLRRARRDRGPAHHRGARQDQRGARAAPLPEDARGSRAAPLQGLRHRAACRSRPRATARPSSAARTIPNAATPARSPATTRATRRSTARCSASAPSAARSSRTRRAEAQPVTLHKGPYGYYVQLGEADGGRRSRRAPRSRRAWTPRRSTLERALELLSLPRLIGRHPEDGEPVEAGDRPLRALRQARQDLCQHPRRRGGLHHRHEPRGGAPRAEGAARARPRRAVKPLRELGEHPEGGAVAVYEGRYGPYVKWDKVNATLPKEIAPEAVTLDAGARADRREGPRASAGPRPRRRRREGGEDQGREAQGRQRRRPPAREEPPARVAVSLRAPCTLGSSRDRRPAADQ